MGWGLDLQGEISNAGKPEAKRHGCWKVTFENPLGSFVE